MKKTISILLTIAILTTGSFGVYAQTVDDSNKNYKMYTSKISNVVVRDAGIEVDGKYYTQVEFVELIQNEGVIVRKPSNQGVSCRSIGVSEMAPYIGWTISVPGLGKLCLLQQE